MEKLPDRNSRNKPEEMSINVSKPENRREDYQRIHGDMLNTILRLWQDHNRLPTDDEIAVAMGVARRTVVRHKAHINIGMLAPDLKVLAPKVIERFTARVLTNPTAKDVRLFLEIAGAIDKLDNGKAQEVGNPPDNLPGG